MKDDPEMHDTSAAAVADWEKELADTAARQMIRYMTATWALGIFLGFMASQFWGTIDAGHNIEAAIQLVREADNELDAAYRDGVEQGAKLYGLERAVLWTERESWCWNDPDRTHACCWTTTW